MIATELLAEHHILLVTSQGDAIAPLAAVIKNLLHQDAAVVKPYEVLSYVVTQPVALVIMDVQKTAETLPLLRSLKERIPAMPVVAIVPYGNVLAVESAIEHGADDYIAQPVSIERLKVTLRNALRLRELLAHAPNETMQAVNHMSLMLDTMGNLKTLKEVEDAVIEYAISSCAGCITQAARALGIGRSTLYRKMQEKIQAHPQISRENHTTRPMMAVSSRGDS